LKHAETTVEWRDATPADLPDIDRLWDEQEIRFQGTNVKVDRPQLFAGPDDSQAFAPYRPPIMRLRVAIEKGKITGFRYVEAVPEVTLVTGSEAVMRSLARELVEECHYFRNKGFRSGWGLVPVKFARSLGRFLRTTPLRVWENLRLIGCDFTDLGD
jgi:hypothetical protein